tara:strand:- start:1597 stop:1788 length:192 start_codon:yes stop_codon:yes gene_type:complete
MKSSNAKNPLSSAEKEGVQFQFNIIIYITGKIRKIITPFKKTGEGSMCLYETGWIGMWRHPYY